MAALLTYRECDTILQAYIAEEEPKLCRAELENFELLPALNVIGFLGEYYNLTLNYVAFTEKSLAEGDDGCRREARLFVKSLSLRYAEPEKESIFRKEMLLYTELLRKLRCFSPVNWCPSMYYVRTDLLVLQDLNQRGYALTSNVFAENLTEREMKHILCSLAALHAASIAYEVSAKINIGVHYQEILREITVAPSVTWYTTGLRAIISIIRHHPKYQKSELQLFIATELKHHLDAVYAMIQPSVKYRNVLCHRDSWSGNIFFKQYCESDSEPAILVDYQTCRYCPPAIDVVFVLFMNLDKEQRKLHAEKYLRWYYQHFQTNMQYFDIAAEQHITVNELLASYAEFQLFGYVYKAIANTILKVPPELVTNAYKYENRTDQVLGYMEQNSLFRRQMEESAEDIMHLVHKF